MFLCDHINDFCVCLYSCPNHHVRLVVKRVCTYGPPHDNLPFRFICVVFLIFPKFVYTGSKGSDIFKTVLCTSKKKRKKKDRSLIQEIRLG